MKNCSTFAPAISETNKKDTETIEIRFYFKNNVNGIER